MCKIYDKYGLITKRGFSQSNYRYEKDCRNGQLSCVVAGLAGQTVQETLNIKKKSLSKPKQTLYMFRTYYDFLR